MRGTAGGTSTQQGNSTASFMGNLADRGFRYAVGSKGKMIRDPNSQAVGASLPAGLKRTKGFGPLSTQQMDKAIYARGGKRIAAAVAMGYMGAGYMKRTKSGLPKGRVQGMYKY